MYRFGTNRYEPFLTEMHVRWPDFEIHLSAWNGTTSDFPILIEVLVRNSIALPPYVTHTIDLCKALRSSMSVSSKTLKASCTDVGGNMELNLDKVYRACFSDRQFRRRLTSIGRTSLPLYHSQFTE